MPKKLWPFLQNYMKLILLETTGDQYKQSALWQRFKGLAGLESRTRTLLGSMQLGDPRLVSDSFAGEAIHE